MNRAEALVDRIDPRVSVRLRWLKKRWQRDLLLQIIRRVVGPGDVVLDIGANRGVYTHVLARRVGPRGRVHSFDPVPVNIRSLEVLARATGNVEVHPVALSDGSGSAGLHVPLVGGRPVDALARLDPPPTDSHETIPVALAALDDELGADGPPVTFVKCDVEGHEQEVLAGGERLLTTHLPALLVEIEQRHRRDDIAVTFDTLARWGYDGYGLTARSIMALADFDVERDQLRHLPADVAPDGMPEGYVGNFLFVRPGTDLDGLARP